MNALQMLQLARATDDQEHTVFNLPLDQQKALAKQMKFDDFNQWKKQVKAYIETLSEDDDDDDDDFEVMTAREYLNKYPPDEQYAAACYLARVYGNDMDAKAVLKQAGFADNYIAKISPPE